MLILILRPRERRREIFCCYDALQKFPQGKHIIASFIFTGTDCLCQFPLTLSKPRKSMKGKVGKGKYGQVEFFDTDYSGKESN